MVPRLTSEVRRGTCLISTQYPIHTEDYQAHDFDYEQNNYHVIICCDTATEKGTSDNILKSLAIQRHW